MYYTHIHHSLLPLSPFFKVKDITFVATPFPYHTFYIISLWVWNVSISNVLCIYPYHRVSHCDLMTYYNFSPLTSQSFLDLSATL